MVSSHELLRISRNFCRVITFHVVRDIRALVLTAPVREGKDVLQDVPTTTARGGRYFNNCGAVRKDVL